IVVDSYTNPGDQLANADSVLCCPRATGHQRTFMPALVQISGNSLKKLAGALTSLLCLLSGASISASTDNSISSFPPTVQQRAYSDAELLRILDDSGVLAQFTSVADTVIEESRTHWRRCDVYPSGIELWISESLSAQNLNAQALGLFAQLVAQHELETISAWLKSPAGQAISAAEQATPVPSENEFRQLLEMQYALPDYQAERAPRIRALIDNTAAATIFTALNIELDALVQLASACTDTSDSVQRIVDAAIKNRESPGLINIMMRLELNAPTTVIFRNTSDAEIDAYLNFSRSSIGRAYHSALVSVVRNTMIDRLQAMAQWRMAKK
ncbi:MAG: DUF2059 domain-containing protein, partial [Granulosicoccus sp.]